MGDLMASGTNPGSTYTITPLDPGVYHEDRVVVTTVSGISTTQMFRVYGATLVASDSWAFQSGVSRPTRPSKTRTVQSITSPIPEPPPMGHLGMARKRQ